LVKYGPTSMNNQPLRITIVRSSESRERLVTHMSGNNAAKTSTAPLTLILSADSDFHEHFPTTFPVAPDARDNFARMPVEARESAADLNASLQIAYLIMGVRAAGLARSEEHTSELQSRFDLVCRLLLEKKNNSQCSETIY